MTQTSMTVAALVQRAKVAGRSMYRIAVAMFLMFGWIFPVTAVLYLYALAGRTPVAGTMAVGLIMTIAGLWVDRFAPRLIDEQRPVV